MCVGVGVGVSMIARAYLHECMKKLFLHVTREAIRFFLNQNGKFISRLPNVSCKIIRVMQVILHLKLKIKVLV